MSRICSNSEMSVEQQQEHFGTVVLVRLAVGGSLACRRFAVVHFSFFPSALDYNLVHLHFQIRVL